MPGHVAILEDNADRAAELRTAVAALLPSYAAVVFDNAPDMIAWLREHLAQTVLISLDHDLPTTQERAGRFVDPGTGRDVADFLALRPPVCPVIVHTSNGHFAPGMMRALADGGWPTARVHPDPDHAFVGLAWVAQVRRWVASGLIFG